MLARILVARKGQGYRVTLRQEGFDRSNDTFVDFADAPSLKAFLADPVAVAASSIPAAAAAQPRTATPPVRK